jgi:dihydrofolate reductase
MRKVVASHFITLDGFIVGPDEDVSWVIDGFDAAMQDDIAQTMSESFDLYVFGRVTYDIFAPYWPHAVPYEPGDERSVSAGKEDARIIRALNDTPKLVFSTTLEKPEWQNTRVLRGGVEDEIRRLKSEPGKSIQVQGSTTIVHALQRADLIDEYNLFVHPVVLGDGKRLFADGATRQNLELTAMKTYANGVISTTYSRKREAS